jgi:predicted dehydrogenase
VSFVVAVLATVQAEPTSHPSGDELKLGIIGLDTSHAPAFAQLLNAKNPPEELQGCRVAAAYPYGSRDIQSSASRIPQYTKEVEAQGVEIVDSIDALLERVDCVLLETNDGRLHWEQALPVIKSGKPLFIDKPIAASLADAIAIFDAAAHYRVPVFSASSLRYGKNTQAVRSGQIGQVLGCDTISPCTLEATHPDLFWYGIHGVETLFTAMGTGCEKVTRTSTPNAEVVVGQWSDGRLGTFRGMRVGPHHYGGLAIGEEKVLSIGDNAGYKPLLIEIIRFFRTGTPPVSRDETIEIFAFMQAAEESKRQGGASVALASVMEAAEQEAAAKRSW